MKAGNLTFVLMTFFVGASGCLEFGLRKGGGGGGGPGPLRLGNGGGAGGPFWPGNGGGAGMFFAVPSKLNGGGGGGALKLLS